MSDGEKDPVVSSQATPSASAPTETAHTSHTPVKRLRLGGKQHVQNCESSESTHVPSEPMDLSDMSARVRVNMKRERSKQRRVLENPGEVQVMIGEVQVNEEVEHPRSEVSATEFDDGQQRELEGILRELQSKNDSTSMHGVSSSVVANKVFIKKRWVLKEQGEGVKARLVMKHFNTWKDENNEFYAEHARSPSDTQRLGD